MTITWYGQSCFKLDTREATLAIDPFPKELGLTPPRFHADAVLVTHRHWDHSHTAAVPGEPLVIAGPGEFEIKGVSIRGIPTFHDAEQGRERGLNTAFRIEAEGMTLAHLGDFGESAVREETLEALGNVDLVCIPVGGTYTIDGETAAAVVNQIEPRVAIPMHYRLPGLKVKLSAVDDFLASYGTPSAERVEKLHLKRKDLAEENTRIVVMNVT